MLKKTCWTNNQDNATYHTSKYSITFPSSSAIREEQETFCDTIVPRIPWKPLYDPETGEKNGDTVTSLRQKIKARKNEMECEVERLCREHGIQLLMLPPYTPEASMQWQ